MKKTPRDRWLEQARCGARNKSGTPCQRLAMKNGRCQLHGGKSTGAKTKEGIERIRQANITHGRTTAESLAKRRLIRKNLKLLEELYLTSNYDG